MFIFLILVALTKVATFDILIEPQIRPNFSELVSVCGYESETHQTVSEDGYTLTLFHIPGDKTRPVLLMHGVLDSADTFVLRGNGSLGCALAQEGYDVWVGNYRGNRYNRRHTTLDPIEPEFWNFTFHKMGYYDLPAEIDFILDQTGQTQLSAIGFSQGSTIFFVLGSTRPEYNKKIKIFVGLGPVAFLKHVGPPVSTAINLERFLSRITENTPELLNRKTADKLLSMCKRPGGYQTCRNLMFAFGGADAEEFELDFLNLLLDRYPESVSRKLAKHSAQLNKAFAQYDYGPSRNIQVYNDTKAPEYNLCDSTMKTALFVGANDKISVAKDVEMLRDMLPNVVEHRVLERNEFNHIDFVWGRNMHKYLFPFVFDTLKKYS